MPLVRSLEDRELEEYFAGLYVTLLELVPAAEGAGRADVALLAGDVLGALEPLLDRLSRFPLGPAPAGD